MYAKNLPAWELNDKVVEFIFFSNNPGKEELRREEKKLETNRISKNNLLRGTAFYRGKVVAEEEKTGFTNIEQVIKRLLSSLSDDIPRPIKVQIKITNLDKRKVQLYQRMLQ